MKTGPVSQLSYEDALKRYFPKLSLDLPLLEQMDSLQFASLIAELEIEFKVSIDPTTLFLFKKITALQLLEVINNG